MRLHHVIGKSKKESQPGGKTFSQKSGDSLVDIGDSVLNIGHSMGSNSPLGI
jgi:hypothetical protein